MPSCSGTRCTALGDPFGTMVRTKPRCQLGTKTMQNPPFDVDWCSDGHWGTILLGWVAAEGDLLSSLKVFSWRFRWSLVSAFRSFWLVLYVTFSCKVFCWGIAKNLSPSKLGCFNSEMRAGKSQAKCSFSWFLGSLLTYCSRAKKLPKEFKFTSLSDVSGQWKLRGSKRVRKLYFGDDFDEWKLGDPNSSGNSISVIRSGNLYTW
jgi:hypothetical protein